MSKRYIKERSILTIEPKQGDSSVWRSALRQREQIAKYAQLGAHNYKRWTRKGTKNSIGNTTETLRPDLPRTSWLGASGRTRSEKVAFNLWRVRWRNLPTKDRLINRGMSITGECNLCDTGMESIDHLFFGCDYAKWVLREAMEATGSLVNTSGINSLEEAAHELKKSPPDPLPGVYNGI